MEIFYIAIIVLGVIASIARRRNHHKKIERHINEIGGENILIERISYRDEIYSVNYEIDGKMVNQTVKFSFLNGDEWY